jgi:glyoxylase-like metal-dependent hydrolase (beta-lactamase superfamily II)/rhodanese-related sulfurtransferase
MEIKRFYLACLAHASYLIHDGGEATVIDPQRDVNLYLEEARELGVRIRWVIETHLHADFVSGHLELAARAGAVICLGAGSGATFAHRDLNDNDELPLGAATLRTFSTPGHTEESISILALEPLPNGGLSPVAVFTGDTLFIGDVGRPDLSPTKSPQELAALLFDSLHHKLLTLPDETLVYPAHGAGSLCGRQMSADASSTIGKERRLNYALQPKERDQFVSLLTAEMPPRPAYFQNEVARNRIGAVPLEQLPPVRALTPEEVVAHQSAGAVVIDTRPREQFGAAHLPGSLHIALSGQFASWAARLLGIETSLILVAENDAAVEEARMRLARVGIEKVEGALAGGILAWIDAGKTIRSVDQISAQDAAEWLSSDPDRTMLLDVREKTERVAAGFVPGSISIPLPELEKRLNELDRDRTVLVLCRSGYRSSIASSILDTASFPQLANIQGGYDAWALSFPSAVNAPTAAFARS